MKKCAIYECCSKLICKGCDIANKLREHRVRLQNTCPFCREALPATKEDRDKLRMKRIEANDPVAMCRYGVEQYEQGDYDKAFEYLTKAAEFGDAEAHYRLSNMYEYEHGVEKDEEMKIYHLKEASIRGHPDARYYLGWQEWSDINYSERTVKHWIISATQGHVGSIKELMNTVRISSRLVSKEDVAVALRAHHAAVEATKSRQREVEDKFERIRSELTRVKHS